jgi:hypothetical protein
VVWNVTLAGGGDCRYRGTGQPFTERLDSGLNSRLRE